MRDEGRGKEVRGEEREGARERRRGKGGGRREGEQREGGREVDDRGRGEA